MTVVDPSNSAIAALRVDRHPANGSTTARPQLDDLWGDLRDATPWSSGDSIGSADPSATFWKRWRLSRRVALGFAY